ncbi:MAG: PQQ-binding-like beta-propeller repeat protein [Oscillospiraceae bacterium]|nr:PQQ-binding-like beta-propeller repeat protein [Oscillospiraceae bacterium]
MLYRAKRRFGRVYVAGRSAKIFCLDAENGDILWSSYSHDTTTWFSGGSVCIGDTLYTCTSDERTLVSFKKDTGEFQRIYPTGANAYTAPVLHGDNIVLAASNVYSFRQSYIMEFDTANHTKLWEAELPCSVLSSPAVYEDAVYFGSDTGVVYCINLK